MNYSQQDIQQAIADIKRATGLDVARSANGAWSVRAGNSTVPVSGDNSRAFEDVLAQAAAARAAGTIRTHGARSPRQSGTAANTSTQGNAPATAAHSVTRHAPAAPHAASAPSTPPATPTSGASNPYAGMGRMFGGIGHAAGGIATAGAGLIGSGLGMVSRVGMGVAGVGLSLAGGLAGGAVNAISTAIIGAVAVGVIAGIGAIHAAVNLGSTAVRSLIGFVKSLATEAERFGRDVSLIRAQSGLSYGRAGAMALGFGAVGLGGAAVGMSAQNPAFFGMRAGLFGLPGYDNPNFISAAAARFQGNMSGGFFGHAQNKMMLASLGMDNPEMIRALTINPGRLRENQSFTSNLAGGLGLNTKSIKTLSDDIYLLQARASSAASVIKLRLAQELLPYVERALSWVSANSGKIVDGIKAGVRWIIEDAPPMMLRGSAVALDALGAMAGGFSRFATSVADNLPTILGAVDFLIAGFRQSAAVIYGIGKGISYAAQQVLGGGGGGAVRVPSGALNPAMPPQPGFPGGIDPFGLAPQDRPGYAPAGFVDVLRGIGGLARTGLTRGRGFVNFLDDAKNYVRPGVWRGVRNVGIAGAAAYAGKTAYDAYGGAVSGTFDRYRGIANDAYAVGQQGYRDALGAIPQVTVSQHTEALQKWARQAAEFGRDGEKWFGDRASAARAAADGYSASLDGTGSGARNSAANRTEDLLAEMVKLLRDIHRDRPAAMTLRQVSGQIGQDRSIAILSS